MLETPSNPTSSGKKSLILQITLLLLIMAVSFGLGYLLRGESKKAPIVIEKK